MKEKHVSELIMSDLMPDKCVNCKNKVVNGVLEYVIDQTDRNVLSLAECAQLSLESLRRCREFNNCPKSDVNSFTARPTYKINS